MTATSEMDGSGATREKLTAERPSDVTIPFGFRIMSMTGDRGPRDALYIYLIQSGDMVKVGVSNNPKRGLYLRGSYPVPAVFAYQVERQIHAALKDYAAGREWFRVTSATARAAAKPIIKRAFDAHYALMETDFVWPAHRHPRRDQFR